MALPGNGRFHTQHTELNGARWVPAPAHLEDLEKQVVVDLLDERSAESFSNWLVEHPKGCWHSGQMYGDKQQGKWPLI